MCAFVIGKPAAVTFVLGLTHGLLWIFMSLACIAAARLRIVSLRLAVAVAVLGGIGPFFGSYEFIREKRRHANAPSARVLSCVAGRTAAQCERGRKVVKTLHGAHSPAELSAGQPR